MTAEPQRAACTLVCFPYAGGGAAAFKGWQELMADSIAVLPVRLPGRESRINEPPHIDAAVIADALLENVRPPFAFYGHSMGARLAFEVVRELASRRAPLPERLYVGAAGAPHRPEPLGRLAELTDQHLLDELLRLGGFAEQLVASVDLRDLLLPIIRSDIRWVERYEFRPDGPLDVPIVAFAGAADADVGASEMVHWAQHTTAGFRLETLPGGHFFLDSQRGGLASLIRADLTAAGTADTTARERTLAPDEVMVQLADLDRLPGAGQAWGELSPRDALRAARFKADDDRRRYIGQSVLVRRLLRRHGVELGVGEIPTGVNGKPEIDDAGGIRFNASRAGRFVLIGVTSHIEIGVDVEQVVPMSDFGAFCDGALDPAEIREVLTLPEDDRLVAALKIWTAKESTLKATGDGLSVEPARFRFERGPGPFGEQWSPRTQPGLERLNQWRVTHLLLDDAVAAVAVPLDRWRLRFEVPKADAAPGRRL
ncbi:MAG: 4'-phosphopantetheinyl transferase superfamily protein [Pseudonocardiales bacterium]|nr:4'-phosphopantetheinyl transferase superfamily protein [Pseudonocardiales bacterium]